MALQLEAQCERWPAGAARSQLIDTAAITIGRDPACEWVLPDPGVSPRHAQIRPTAAGFEIEALSSTGITAVNDPLRNLALHERVPLAAGDTLFIHAYELRATDMDVRSRESASQAESISPEEDAARLGTAPESMADLLEDSEDLPNRSSVHGDDRASRPNPRGTPLPEGFTYVLVLNAEGPRWPKGARRSAECRSGHLDIGREPPCDWILPDEYVSARHARISREGGEFVIEAWGGTNRTAVNDPALPLPRHTRLALSDQDLIYIDQFRIRVNLRPERNEDAGETPRAKPRGEPETPKADSPDRDSSGTLVDVLVALGLPTEEVDKAGAQRLARSLVSLVEGIQQLLQAWVKMRSALHLTRSSSALDPAAIRALCDPPQTVLRSLLSGAPNPAVTPELIATAFRELLEHQFATAEALQTGLGSMMRRFDPDSLARRSDAHGRGFRLEPLDARRWRDFAEHMRELYQDRERAEWLLFGEAFSNGYQEAIERMRLLQRSVPSRASPAAPER